MAGTTRIPPTEMTGVTGAIAKTMSRRMLGEVPEALQVMWHHRKVLSSSAGLGRKAKKWNKCDQSLKAYAHMAVASHLGCSLCLDFGYFEAENEGLDMDKAREVPRWRESDAFTALEREVLEYAEAMSQTPPAVTDELSARLLHQLGAPGLLELTAYIAMANMMARTNTALGLEAQGLSTTCEVKPLAVASAT